MGTAITHGRRYAYVDYGCRCHACTEANTAYQREANARRAARSFDEIPHGSGGYRNYGCRCDVCTMAHSASCRAYKERRALTADDIPHGIKGYDGYLCRCEVCTAGKREEGRRRRLAAREAAP